MEFVEKYLINTLNISINISKQIFSHPKESRFRKLFQEIKPKNKKRKAMIVNPKKILMNLDKRTSIIIKNIPEEITAEQFKNIIFNFSPYINFFYIPFSILTRRQLRVAFINVVNYKYIVPIYMGLLYKTKFKYSNPDIEIEICYSRVQGKDELIKRFSFEFNENNNPGVYNNSY